MKKRFLLPAMAVTIAAILIVSCKKADNPPAPNPGAVNVPPTARAGPDQFITLPQDSVMLDGSWSTDQDGQIVEYRWLELDGPSSAFFDHSDSAKTLARSLAAGLYLFQLTVMDNLGLVAKDVVNVRVDPQPVDYCNLSNRPQINAGLIHVGSLSQPRSPAVAAAGNKIVFAGGATYSSSQSGIVSDVVDIYDAGTQNWSTAHLSQARTGIAAIAAGTKIFFAGGSCNCYEDYVYDNVDIYDITTNTWSLAHLSAPRAYVAAAVVGNKVLFAGGGPDSWSGSRTVDIFDLSSNTWSTALLSKGRYSIGAVTVGNKVYFAGGSDFFFDYSDIDIYDNGSNSWSTASLQQLAGGVSGVAIGNKIYWSGLNASLAGKFEIWNTNNNSVTVDCLSYPRFFPTTVLSSNTVAVFGWNFQNFSNRFDLFDVTNGTWSIGLINESLAEPAIISVNNVIYIAGGKSSPLNSSDKVYSLSY